MIKSFLKDNGISTPEDLLSWMTDHVEYGFVDHKNKRHTDFNFRKINFYELYRLQSPTQLINSKLGVCWDQVELERACFKEMKYQFDTYYFEQVNKYQSTHTFLAYWYKSKLYWFENSYFNMRGIHGPYSSRVELFKELYAALNKEEPDTGVFAYMLHPPKYGSTCQQYMDSAKKYKHVWTAVSPVD